MSDSSDRTIPATPRRREQARRQGCMPPALQPAWVAAAATAFLLLPAWSRAILPPATEMMRSGLAAALVENASAGPGVERLVPLAIILPTAAVVTAAGVVGLAVRLCLDGNGWSLSRAAPSLMRLSPVAGLARIFSLTTVARGIAGMAGLCLMVSVAVISAAPLMSALAAADTVADVVTFLGPLERWLGVVAGAAAACTIGQWLLERRRFEHRIRMTPQEFADEARGMRAAPQVRLLQRRRPATPRRFRPAPADSPAAIGPSPGLG